MPFLVLYMNFFKKNVTRINASHNKRKKGMCNDLFKSFFFFFIHLFFLNAVYVFVLHLS